MSIQLTNIGPQRKLLGARKRCSNGSLHDQEINQPSKYFRESSAGVDRESKAGVDRESSADVDRESSAGVDRESSADVDRESSAGVDRESSADVDRESSADVDRESSAGVDRESSAGVDRSSKDERKTFKPSASNANRGKVQGCEWFENSFCSTRKRSEMITLQESSCTKNLINEKENQESIVERLEVHTENKELQSPRTKQEDEYSNSQKDVFEESFQDLDFLSHVESIESQNSVDFVDTVAESPAENLIVVSRPVDNTQLTVAFGKTESHTDEAVEKTVGGKQSSNLGKNVETASNTLKFEKQADSDRGQGKDGVDTHVSDVLGRTPQTGKEKEGLESIRVGSLRDRLKRKLLQNVGARSPVSPAQTVEEGRQSRIKEVEREAALLQGEGSADDIGPFYGLPSKVQELLQKQRGITALYEWQDRCLKLPSLQKGGNLVYSLPTSGGKTLVAEVLILKELLCKKRDALMILPFVSIVQEKVKGLAQLAVELDFLVEEYAGSRGRVPPIKHRRRCLYIATIEKAHSLVNSLLEQDRLGSLGLVVVDELHMVGEGRSRGACLEATLLKVIHARAATQIIGMSATLNNISDLLSFLKADIFSSDFRPVKLTEYVKLQDNIFEVQKGQTLQDSLDHQRTVTFEYSPEMAKVDPDHLLGLVTEVIPQHSCLIFCPTKKNCENVALMLSKLMAKHRRELSQVRKQERRDLLKELYRDGEQRMCPVLQHTIHFGLAYHHSGLTTDERQLLEAAYTDGVLCVLACTSTLAAGVNLPAKRVILRNPYIGTQFLNRSQYKQMIGRAGRAGKDTTGESILIISPKDRCKVWDIISGPVESCFSSLTYDDGKGIKSLILSSIGLQVTSSTKAVFDMMSQTLLSIQASHLSCDIVAMTKDALQQLIDEGLVVQKRSLSQSEEIFCHIPCLEVTPLGRATFKGSIDLEFSTQLYKDLKKAEESLVLASHLHLLFLVTPYDLVKDVRPSWMTYFKQIKDCQRAS